jgi:hypothetical protein
LEIRKVRGSDGGEELKIKAALVLPMEGSYER